MWKVTANNRETAGNRHRLYASPKWTKTNGFWIAIKDLVEIFYSEGSEEYTLLCGGDFIIMKPKVKLGAAIDKAEIKDGHFGHVLNDKRPDTIEYEFFISDGVTKVANGYKFGTVEGVELGLFWNDWIKTVGKDNINTSKSDSVTLDLREAKTDKEGRINLDPVTINPLSIQTIEAAGGEWAAVRSGNAEEHNNLPSYLSAGAVTAGPFGFAIYRGQAKFSLTGLPETIESAKIIDTYGEAGAADIHCGLFDDSALSTDQQYFNAILAAVTNDPVAPWAVDGDGISADITDQWGDFIGGKNSFGFICTKDKDDDDDDEYDDLGAVYEVAIEYVEAEPTTPEPEPEPESGTRRNRFSLDNMFRPVPRSI